MHHIKCWKQHYKTGKTGHFKALVCLLMFSWGFWKCPKGGYKTGGIGHFKVLVCPLMFSWNFWKSPKGRDETDKIRKTKNEVALKIPTTHPTKCGIPKLRLDIFGYLILPAGLLWSVSNFWKCPKCWEQTDRNGHFNVVGGCVGYWLNLLKMSES